MRIYLDYNATAPVVPEVAEAVSRALTQIPGNASSVHWYGQQAKAAIDDARAAVSRLLGAEAADIVFTSGGTEADNLAIRGIAEAAEARARRRLVASTIEHEAVLATCKHLARRGWSVTWLPVGPSGLVDPADLRAAMGDDVALVSVMHANNEIGTIQPVAELAAVAHEHGALFHTDAVQSAGKVPLDVGVLGVDAVSISGHKFGAPKGVGALWVRRGLAMRPILTGGRQERGRRAGTENVPGIVGLGAAASVAADRLVSEAARLAGLRDRLEQELLRVVPAASVNGGAAPRVPNTTNISFDHVEAESLLIGLDLEGIAVSTGSACSSGTLEPSHVLRAMRLPSGRAHNSIRFSLGAATTATDITRVVAVLPPLVERLRALVRVPSREA